MSKSRGLSVLMIIAIIGITGFQVYWLGQNYDREKTSLSIKARTAFRETIMQLQSNKFNFDIPGWFDSTGNKDIRIILKDGDSNIKFEGNSKTKIISTINIIGDKLKDTLRKTPKAKMRISVNKTSERIKGDSVLVEHEETDNNTGGKNHIINLLYGVDSLQDAISVAEIDSAYKIALQKEKINIPYTILQLDSSSTENENENENAFSRVTIGILKPVTYELQPGNTFPYLLRRIAQPILFSILLLGITILSFVLLYRNLLKQKRLAALKNEFISNITHELKTPIATVGVAIEALKNFNAMENPERTREYLDISTNELQRLSLLVDKVLKLSMFEKKEMELKFEPVNLKDLTEEVVASLKLQLEKKKANVSIHAEGDVSVSGDKLHLLSVIFNLVDNAVKYCRIDPELTIAIIETEHAIEFSIKDNGIGVAPEYREKIFDKFFRIPHGDTHDAKGYGLGLSYVAQVVRQHNGVITVSSKPGDGTMFTITLPKKEI